MVQHIGTWASQALLQALRWKLDEVYMCLLLCPSTYLLKIIASLVMEQFHVDWHLLKDGDSGSLWCHVEYPTSSVNSMKEMTKCINNTCWRNSWQVPALLG